LRELLTTNGLDGYIDNFERYGFDEESITAVELRDYDVLGIGGEDRQKLFKLIQRFVSNPPHSPPPGPGRLTQHEFIPAADVPAPCSVGSTLRVPASLTLWVKILDPPVVSQIRELDPVA